MNIRNTVRSLAVAALLAVTVVSLSAGQADARPRKPQGPITLEDVNSQQCAIQGVAVGQPQYDWVFYLAGDYVSFNGLNYVCSGFGTWRMI